MPDWSLAVTSPNAERLVSDELSRLSYQHIWFKRRGSAVVSGRVVERELPAFPRYVFVLAGSCWDVVRDVGRVLGLVQFGEEVGVVPGRVVDQLIARCGGGDVLPPEAVPEPFRRGDRVVVNGYGPASGQCATYDSLAEGGKLRLLFEGMGRIIPIDVDGRDVAISGVTGKDRKRRRRSRKGSRRTLHTSATS